eukprot:7749919-Alexandrium_andersonii.AAC.1
MSRTRQREKEGGHRRVASVHSCKHMHGVRSWGALSAGCGLPGLQIVSAHAALGRLRMRAW